MINKHRVLTLCTNFSLLPTTVILVDFASFVIELFLERLASKNFRVMVGHRKELTLMVCHLVSNTAVDVPIDKYQKSVDIDYQHFVNSERETNYGNTLKFSKSLERISAYVFRLCVLTC